MAEVYAVRDNTHRSGISRRGTSWSDISWIDASYRVGDDVYQGSYLKNGYDGGNRFLEIRYLVFAPDISRANTFISNWGPVIMAFVVLTLITSIVFIRKDIVSDQAIFTLQAKRPFIKIENNRIEDYDVHDIDSENPQGAEEAFRKRLADEVDVFQKNEVSASVYKFNPNAIGIFVAYVILFFYSFYLLLTGSLGYPGIFFLGSVLLFVPLYIQNTNNPVFKAKIPDAGSLVFSPQGVQFKEEFNSKDDIEAAVVYLESFRGFEYVERITTGKAKTVSAGDNNKISYRSKGQITDFTFILDDFADYWSFKNLMSNWAGAGINVVMEKVFEDDFVIQEMVRYGTPVTPS
jgi:hypothetical protein